MILVCQPEDYWLSDLLFKGFISAVCEQGCSYIQTKPVFSSRYTCETSDIEYLRSVPTDTEVFLRGF